MTMFKSILAASALALSTAIPATALEIGLGGELDLFEEGRVIGIGLNAGIGDEVEGAESANETEAAASAVVPAAPNMQVDADSPFLGQIVTFADGGTVGMVNEVYVDGEGGKRLHVDIDDGLGWASEEFVIGLGADVEAEDQLQLSMTQAELTQRIQSQISAVQ